MQYVHNILILILNFVQRWWSLWPSHPFSTPRRQTSSPTGDPVTTVHIISLASLQSIGTGRKCLIHKFAPGQVRIEQFCCRLQALVVSTYPVAFWIFQWGIVSPLYLAQNITGNPGSPDWTDFGHLLVASRCPEYPQPGVYVGMLDMQNQRIAKKKVSVENVATQKMWDSSLRNPHVREIDRGRF